MSFQRDSKLKNSTFSTLCKIEWLTQSKTKKAEVFKMNLVVSSLHHHMERETLTQMAWSLCNSHAFFSRKQCDEKMRESGFCGYWRENAFDLRNWSFSQREETEWAKDRERVRACPCVFFISRGDRFEVTFYRLWSVTFGPKRQRPENSYEQIILELFLLWTNNSWASLD